MEQICCKFLVQVCQDEQRRRSFVSCWDDPVKIFLRYSLENWRDEERRGEERREEFLSGCLRGTLKKSQWRGVLDPR